jgi:hypothetical protein
VPSSFKPLCDPPIPPDSLRLRTPALWVHLIGDSVVEGMLRQTIADGAFTPRRAVLVSVLPGANGRFKDGSKAPRKCACVKQGAFDWVLGNPLLGVQCFTTLHWFDSGERDISIPANVDEDLLGCVKAQGYRSQPAPHVVMFSLGYHHKSVWGGDDSARSHFRKVFARYVRSMGRQGTRGFVLITESARDTAMTPFKFSGPSTLCLLTNVRTQGRNFAMVDALNRACEVNQNVSRAGIACRVLDLFSPTNALVGAAPGLFYNDRDPIHFLKHKPNLLSFVTPMAKGVLTSVINGLSSHR